MAEAATASFAERAGRRLNARLWVGSVTVALFLLAWQFVGSRDIIRSDLISFPGEIFASARDLVASGELGVNAAATLREFAIGFGPAIIVGVMLGVGFATSRVVRYLFEPLFVAMYTAPLIAFVPLFVVWFGVGEASKSVTTFIAALVPIAINTTTGVRETHESWIRACRAFGATRGQIIAKAILPGALPVIMAGLRLAVGRAIVGVIGAEMYVSVRGVGRLIQTYSTAGRAAEIFVLVGVVSGFGFLVVGLLRAIENRLAPWRARP